MFRKKRGMNDKKVLRFEVCENHSGSSEFKIIEIVTDRTPEWTISQYLRNRENTTMKLLQEADYSGDQALLFNNKNFMYQRYG